MTLNDILKDPNYQGLPEAERRKVWHKLFDRQYGSDPNFMGLPQEEQRRARDMYADRVMGSEPRQVPTAEQTGYTPEKDVMLAGIKRYEDKQDAARAASLEKIKPDLGVGLPVDKINYALDPNRDQPQIRASRPTRTTDEDLKEILSGNELRPDYMLTPEMAHDKAELSSIKAREAKEIAAEEAAKDRRIALGKLKNEYFDNEMNLAKLSVKRDSWDKGTRAEYAELLQRQAEIEIEYPAASMGMTRRQYDMFQAGQELIKDNPLLTYPDIFVHSLAHFVASPALAFTPGSFLSDYLTYPDMGVASEGSPLGNMLRGTVGSLPMNIAMMVNPAAGAALTFTDITSRDIKQYYDAGTLDAANVMASIASGAIQTVIEYMSTESQLAGYRDIYRKGGTESLQSAVLKETRDAMMPSFSRVARSLAHGAITEGLEEVAQNVADRVVKMVMLDEPMPGNKQELMEWGKELALDFAGGALGGFLMGGGATGVQIYQHNEVAKYIQHNAKTYESIQMLQQSIDIINNAKSLNDIDTASDLLRDAKAKAVKEGVEHPRLLQGFNLASSAIMANRANQVQAIKAANQELGKEITELKQQADTIRREGFEPGFETEQGAKLYELEDQIKVKEREYKKGLQQIHSNKELEMMSEAIERMDIEMAQLHAESAGMPYDAEYDPATDQGKEIKSPVMMEGRRRETMPEKKAAPIESKQEDSTSSSEPVPVDSNTAPSQAESTMPAEPANTENDKITSIKLDSETKQSKSLTIGKINEDVDRADPKESKRIPEEALGSDKTVVKGRGKGSKHKIRHALIPLKDILVSHDTDFNENKDYPQELQPRDRSKGASRAKNNQVTAELDPYRLMDNYLASEGRPIVVVDKDGRIIALTGNGRLIALKRRAAGEYDGIQEYEQTLREHLEDFGINDQDTAGKVLVGVYYGDADLIQLANAMNESEGDAMSPVEQAAADAKQIANLKKHGDDIIEVLDVNTEDVMSAANTGFLKLFAERLGLDLTKYQTADGKWNKDFRTRVENALFMYIFNNNESAKRALSAWREDETSNMKSVLTGVMNAIKLIAKYRNAVEKYKTVDLDITVDLLEAIDVITRLRKEGKTLEQEANEMDLFSDGNEAIPSDKLSLYQAIATIKTIKRGTEFIKGYYSEAMELADPNQMTFMYDPDTSKEDFLNEFTEGFKRLNEKAKEKKKLDKGGVQRSSTEASSAEHGEDREGSRGSDRSEEDVVSGRRLRTGANESRLNSIPDSVAEDALLGLFKSHIAKTERDGRKLAITFKDGRKLTLDRLNKNFKITMPDGRKLDMYGRTYSKTIDGTFNVFMDLVDGLNGGNRTLYHEAFHVAWKLFMTTEQIDLISRYYAKKLGPEASIVDIEEAAANAAQNWLGNRAEVPPGFRNIFRRFWDRVRHALVSLGLANENQKIEDIFWGLEQDRLQGKGTEDKSSDKISQSSDNATFSQGKSLVADTENLNNETEVRYRLESGDNKYAFNIMEGYKPTNTVKGYKAFVRDKDGNLKPLFVSNDISIPIGKWLEAKDTWHFQAENGLYYVPTGGEDADAKKSKNKKDEKKTGVNVPIPNEKVRAELIKRGFLPKGSKAKTVKAVAYRPGWHGSLLPLAKQLGNQTASISRNTGTSFDGYDYSNVYQEDIVFAEVEFDMSNDYQGVASKETGLQRMPEKGGYQFTTNKKNEDPKNPWFISGAIKVGRVLDRSEVNELVKKAGLPIKKWRDEINTSKGEGVTKDGVRYRLDKAYHGSGALFNRFDVKYIGTGEGAQSFGWGIYVTENEAMARDYAKRLGAKKNPADIYVGDVSLSDYLDGNNPQRIKYSRGLYESRIQLALSRDAHNPIAAINQMIEVELHKETPDEQEISRLYKTNELLQRINNDLRTGFLYTLSVWENHQEDVLDWYGKVTDEQLAKIQGYIDRSRKDFKPNIKEEIEYQRKWLGDEASQITGQDVYYQIFRLHDGSPKAASQFLLRAGIDGIKYPANAMSGGTGNKKYNYVVFDDSQITILETTRYRAVEEKNLVTIHNIPVDSIEKVNNRGGMVMPSIAIIDATKTKFTGFGDASLIGDEKMIQPSAKQPLYTSDAYTPTYPKVYEIVKMDKNLEALAEYLSKKTKKKVTTWDLEANIEDQGSERYVASLLYGVMDYKKAQKEAIRTLEKYPINIEEKIFAGYTRNGQRRYIPHTVENALRIMRKDSKDDPSTFWGTSSLRGALAAKFSSLAQAKKNRDMILSKAEMEPIEEATDKMFEDIAARANAVRKNQRAFYLSDIASDIYDMARYGWGRIADWYKDDSIKEDFRSFISHLRSLPTQYFEYKPQRVVGINEFVAAVIPTGTKASTAKALRDAGLKVVKYKAGDDDARYEAVKKVSEEMWLRFRAEPSQAEIAEAERQMAEVRAKYEVTEDYELTELEERSGYSKGFSKGMTHVHYKGKAFHKGDRSVIDMLLKWNKDAESDTSRQMLPSLSTQESDRLFNQFGSEIVVVHDMDIEGKWAPEDADAGRYYGYDEFRVEMTAKDALNSISQIILSDEFYEYVQNTEDENTDDSQYEYSQDYRNWVWELINPENPWYDKIVKASDSGYRADFLNFDDGSGDSRIKYKDGYLKAPNGKPTNLTERQWLQVRTENFKKWFGDWENDPKNASKVVDENGEPMVVYHHTGNDFTEFMSGGQNSYMGMYSGEWFTTEKSKPVGTLPSADSRMDLFLNIRNPQDITDIQTVFFNIEENEDYIGQLEDNGNDGIRVYWDDEFGGETFIAFAPTQIKSATANVGIFDPQTPDIRYRLTDPEVNAKFNEDLSLFAKNELPKRHKFSLGSPGLILIESGFPDAPIEMLIGVLKDKIRSHDIDTGKIINLPQAINDPVFVAKSKSKERSLVVFTEIEHADGNLMVAVSIDKVRDGIKVNDIRSIYGKNSENIIAWFRDDQEQFTYINENKSLDWLNRSAGSQSRKLAQATKAIDKIASRVGLSSAKFAKVREMLEQDSTTRYRIEDTDLDARLKRAHEMLKKYKANVDPKEASEKIATEIAKAKNLDPSQADEKIGRMIRAAYREGEGKAKESLAAFGIAETEAFIQTNKPDGTDKQDLTFHMEEALEYAADMGLSEADVKNLGADRFTYYLQGLNMYAYGNALTQQLNDKYAEKQALAAKGITNEALDQEISNLISLVADARLKYENMKGAAGRLLQHARWEKSNRIKDLIKIAEVITETRDAQIAEINAIEAEMAELNTMLTELEKEFELLLDDIERLSGSRFKSDSIEELRERKRLMAEQRAEMKNRMEVLKHRLAKAREGLQTSEKQNRAIREQLDKAGQIEFTEEEQNVLKQIVESGVLNEEQLEAIGTTMKTGFRPTATGLRAIAPLTGSTSDLTPKQAALIQKILDHGKKPPTVTEFPLMDADWIDVVSNAFYQIILSSPITHARNLIGNESNLALENIVNTVLHRDLRPVINSILSAKEGVRNTKEAWKHAEAYMKKYNLDVNSRIMKKFTMITRSLAAEDAFYYSRNYAAQITSIAIAEAKRTGRSVDYLLRNPSLAMIKQAEYEAARGTWNYDPEGILGYVTKAIETGIGMAQHGGKLGKISALLFKMNVMPFTRVVANVLNTALDWSPVGYLGAVKYATGLVDKEFKLGKGVTIRQRKVWTDEKGNAIKSPFAKRDTTRQLARATIGTIMLSLAYMLLEGIISGSGPDDWEERRQLMETGWRPNSIKIAGRWHSYMMLPIAPMLSAIANFQERRRKPGARAEEVLAATVMGMANTILDQSFLSNLAQLMEAITGNNHRYLIRAAADTPTRVIPISPNLLRVIADAVNDKAYAPETFIQYLMYSGRPWTNGWIKDNIPARIDVFGREAKKTSSFRDFPGSPVMDGQPLYVYDKNDIPYDMRSVLNTILGAGLKIPSTNAYEAKVGDDQFIKLKGFDKEQFLRQRGFYLSMGLLSYQEDIEYLAQEGEIDELDNLLRKIASRATKDAKREMIYRYIDGEMRHKYSVYSKSRNRRKDEED